MMSDSTVYTTVWLFIENDGRPFCEEMRDEEEAGYRGYCASLGTAEMAVTPTNVLRCLFFSVAVYNTKMF